MSEIKDKTIRNGMNFLELPDDIFVNLFDKYLDQSAIEALYNTCLHFRQIIDNYNLWLKYLNKIALIDYSYPHGFSNFDKENTISSYERLKIGSRWIKNIYKKKIFYSFPSKMLPHIQIDNFTEKPMLYTSDANKLVGITLDKIQSYLPTKYEQKLLTQRDLYRRPNQTNKPKSNKTIQINEKFEIENDDITNFMKKDEFLVSITNKKLAMHNFSGNNLIKLFELEENDYGNKINCTDFSTMNNKLVYGCSDGTIKVHDIKKENLFSTVPVAKINLHDRVLRCVFSPSLKNLGIGTAGVRLYDNTAVNPLLIYDFERLKEIQNLQPRNTKGYKKGAGILALSYIDENTIMSSGYDTFIRIFDIRSNKCVQELEEPEDMSIYCVCVSKFYGLLSGNNRQSIIRYWDRRQAKIISTFTASNNNSSIYSLACTPDTIYAAWDQGITSINF